MHLRCISTANVVLPAPGSPVRTNLPFSRIVEQEACDSKEVEASALVEHVRRVAGSDLVVVFVVPEFFEAVGVGGGAGLGGAPEDGVAECPGEEVGGFGGLGATDEELKEIFGLLFFGLSYLAESLTHESTDDAFLDADIVSVGIAL
jgi:hypothetical protein